MFKVCGHQVLRMLFAKALSGKYGKHIIICNTSFIVMSVYEYSYDFIPECSNRRLFPVSCSFSGDWPGSKFEAGPSGKCSQGAKNSQ